MKDILTLPNIISFFRLLLIPIFVITYFNESIANNYIWAIGILLLSGLSDVVDGFIARKFNMVSDFGKILDPTADKLTQAVIVLSLVIKHLELLPMFAVLFFKELFTLFAAVYLFSNGTKAMSSKWFGKLSTVVIFITMFYTVLVDICSFTTIPLYFLSALSIICMIISVTGYFKHFIKQGEGAKSQDETM